MAGGGNRFGGVGDLFTKATGLHARDRSTWRSQVDFALNHAAKHGWSEWHGWKGAPRAGLGGAHQKSFAPLPKRQQPIHIENVHYLDGREIARNTVRHIVHDARHPTSAPFHDGAREWTPPDSGLVTT